LLTSGYTELIGRIHKQIPKVTTDVCVSVCLCLCLSISLCLCVYLGRVVNEWLCGADRSYTQADTEGDDGRVCVCVCLSVCLALCVCVCVQDGLLTSGYTDLIGRIHKQIPKVTTDGKRLQMVVCSATLHSLDVRKMAVSVESSLRL